MKKLTSALVGLAALLCVQSASAADVTLRLHQFLPPQGNVPKYAINTWIDNVQKQSEGRIKVQHFPSMQLGGKPPELFDQAKDGVVDIIWTVLGYTPGRFPKSEVFEMPFSVGDPEIGSRAFQDYVEQYAMDEFKDVKLLAVNVHGPGLFHSKDPITKLEDLKGIKVRGGSRMINVLLEQLGATPVGMPIPTVGEALSKGVITATTIPWEVAPAFKVQQIVRNHTTYSGDKGLYTQLFGFVMNKARYESLSDDLKKVIDDNSGIETAGLFGRAMAKGDVTGRAAAEKNKNNIITLDEAETARWKEAAAGVRTVWFEEVAKKGIDGPALAEAAAKIIEKHEQKEVASK